MKDIKALIALLLIVTHLPFYVLGYLSLLASEAFKDGRQKAKKHSEKLGDWLEK